MASLTSYTDEPDPISLSPRFAKMKKNLIACRERRVADSFYRLLRRLASEADGIAACGSDLIPTINYLDIHDSVKVSSFREALRKRGVAVIKRVIPPSVAQSWREETVEYVKENPQTRAYPLHNPRRLDMYWSPGQVRARADSRVLEAQRFAMSTWHSGDEDALVSGSYPVAYADRLEVQISDDGPFAVGPHLDNGSVERWESDGYGQAGTYQDIFEGRWENYDPWDSSSRHLATTDLYNRASSCSMFRMFQGWLPLSPIPLGMGSLLVCPMLQLTTAYLLLRPFFTPRIKNPSSPDFLHPNNWNMNVSQTSVLHGAIPGYQQEISIALHPHLQLPRTMVRIPSVSPGDYIIWHPDVVHAVNPSRSPSNTLGKPQHPYSDPLPRSLPNQISGFSISASQPSTTAAILYIPACPLTQTNVLYLSRQRRAFLLGLPAPDFAESSMYITPTSFARGNGGQERDHVARPSAQDVSDAGGDDGLRSMGLMPWEEGSGDTLTQDGQNEGRRKKVKLETGNDTGLGSSSTVITVANSYGRGGGDDREDMTAEAMARRQESEQRLLRLANAILFPDGTDQLPVERAGGWSISRYIDPDL
ncbi:hypothetical protein F5Y16DRAFT_288427 [Xylariaceae sp. FL0255]|nr:hypothetical protein F5Y16DRAFT_288427 [Xylariaceae sp. FL0255]